jgi:hypothetical protein
MSVNKYLPHVYVLPEDDAYRHMLNGFFLDECLRQRQLFVLEEAGGWNQVLERFCAIYAAEMDRVPERFMILLIDLDNKIERLEPARGRIPQHLRERVFILSVLTEPEDLKPDLGSLETIGLALAKDCREDTDTTWSHKLLRHNLGEVNRLRAKVRTILYSND